MSQANAAVRNRINTLTTLMWVYFVTSVTAVGMLVGNALTDDLDVNLFGDFSWQGALIGASAAAIANIPVMVIYYAIRLGVLTFATGGTLGHQAATYGS
jgi:hypothetical protein